MNESSDFLPSPMQRAGGDAELNRQKTYLDELFELAPDAVVLTTLRNPRILRINREFTRMFGYTSDEAVGNSLRNLVMPDGFEPILPEDTDLLAGRKVEWEVFRRRKDGTQFHAHITGKRIQLGDDEDAAYIIFRDISARKRADALFAGEKRLLEVIAAGGSLATTLDALCRLAEDLDRSSFTSILLLDRKGKQLLHGAGPSLPPNYIAAINGAPVGLGIGPCAAAAHLGGQVISLDMTADDRWSPEMRALTLAHGLRACWSTPIKSSEGRVLGTFAIYPSEPASPTPEQTSRIEQLTHLASIAIERAQSMDALRQSEERYALAMDAAADGHLDWNRGTGEFYISPRMLKMAGHAPDAVFVDGDDWVRRFPFHPEDRARWEAAIAAHFAGGEAKFRGDFRILVNDEARWLAFNFIATRDAAGNVVRWTGSVADVNDAKRDIATVLDAIPGLVAILTPVGEVDAVNRELIAYCGQPLEAMRQWGTNGIVHPEDLPGVAVIFTHSISAGEPYIFEARIRRFDGAYRWNQVRGLPFRDSSGRVVRWYVLLSDVDASKRAEEALRLSDERYALAMEAAAEGHFDADLETGEMFVSARLNEIYDFPRRATIVNRAEFINQIPLHPEDRSILDDIMEGDRVRPEWQKPDQDHFEYDCRFIPRPGEIRWLHIRGKLIRDAEGRARRRVGVAADITDRKLVEEALREQTERLQLGQAAMRMIIMDWNITDDLLTWSDSPEWLRGPMPASGRYPLFNDQVHPEDRHRFLATRRRALETLQVQTTEFRLVRTDSEVIWVLERKHAFAGADGKPVRMLAAMFDITERKRAEDELQRMERELRQAQRLEALGTLAGGIAHDFNNLLGAILGYGEMALRNVRAGSRQRRDIENILIAGERGHALVERILAFSRSGVGERVAVHVEGVVRETLALFAAKLPRHIVIERRLNAGSAAVMGDPTQIHQVLMNLLTNAVQAMPSGGTLGVSIDRMRLKAPRILITGPIAAREYIALEVSDTGTGIPAEIFERIFDPFFSTKEIGVGTGLGLSLVHGIVTGLGGGIDVMTTVGAGSVFKVYLPLAGDVAVPIKPRKRLKRKAARTGRGRVMVIDDEEALVRLATETLTELGYSATGFASSAKAIAVFLEDPDQFDAVITDESMPGASGSELIRKMRALRPTIPVLLVSGYLTAAVIERAREAGASEVLKKPLSARQLQMAVERALPPAGGPSPEALASAKPNGRATKLRGSIDRSRAQPGRARR